MIKYYDYGGITTATTSGIHLYPVHSSATSCTTITATVVWYQRFLVTAPECWKESDILAFVHLMNIETNTGCTIEMVINGDVLITDPWIHRRTFEEILPLVMMRASGTDKAKIREFIKAHPLTAEVEKQGGNE